MDRKRPLPLPPPDLDSDPDENFSSDDDSEEDKDRLTLEAFDKPCDDQESESQSKEKALRSKFPTRQRDASSFSSSGSDSESDGGSRSELQDASPTSINQNVVLNRKAEANGVAKKTVFDSASARKPLKLERKDEKTAKNVKLERLKRDRDEDSEDKGFARKQKKRSSGNASTGEQNLQKSRFQNIPHVEKADKEEHLSVPNEHEEEDSEKAVQAPSHDSGNEVAKKASKQRTEERSGPISQKKGSRSEKECRRKEKVFVHIHPETHILKEISAQKPRKSSQSWTPKDEIALSSEILNRVKFGADIPSKKNDDFWVKLSEQLQGKLEAQWSRDQLCEKVKRMKKRYDTMADKLRESEKPYKHRNSTDPVLFSLWSQIWGKSDDSISKDNAVEEGKEEASTPVVSATNADPIQESKSILGKNEPRVRKGKQSKKKSSKTDELDSEGSDDRRGEAGSGFAIKSKEHIAKAAAEVQYGDTTRPLERECMPRNHKFPRSIANSLDLEGGGKISEPSSDLKKLLHDGVRPLLLEMQEASKIMLEEWLAKADAFIENALKTAAGISGPINRLDLAGKEGFSSPPWRSWELRACQFSDREQVFQQQLYELHLQELDIYSQRLQLLQRECKLKQEELRLQFERGR